MMDFDDVILFENSYLMRRERRKRKKTRKRYWVHPILTERIRLGEFHHLHSQLKEDEKKFFDYYRMSEVTFNYILHEILPSVERFSNFRDTITPEERLAVTIRYLATGSSFKSLGYSFRISDVTVGRIVKEVCTAIWDLLQSIHLCTPKEDEVDNIVQVFWNRWKFPNCVGCIDGKHIRIKQPVHSGTMFRNYKQYFSIVLQGVAGPDYKFLAIDVGAYGKESDGGIFRHSKLYAKLETGSLGVKRVTPLPGTKTTVPHVLLGDEAYPLKPYLMRPYPSSKLGPSEAIFNYRLSKARQIVECAFGIMTNKWRVLHKAIDVNPEDADTIIKCICLLHNIVIDKEGSQHLPSDVPASTQTCDRFATVGENRGVNAAYIVREKFKTFFINNTCI